MKEPLGQRLRRVRRFLRCFFVGHPADVHPDARACYYCGSWIKPR